MNALDTGCLSLAAALALGAVASEARADDATATAAASPSPYRPAGARPGKNRRVAKTSAVPNGATGKAAAARAASSTTLAAATTPVETLPALERTPLSSAPAWVTEHPAGQLDAARAPETNAKTGAAEGTTPAPGGGTDAVVLAERLLEGQTPIELFNTVIVPAARGMTIAQIQSDDDGTPAVTLAVRPTKITRGSGLVAIGQF